MNNKQEKHKVVSIIIPVYNTEGYLRECLDSAVGQTLRDIEIICVDDGSSDNSLDILEEYQKKDPRILIIHQENAGLSAARNCGMRNAGGEYIYFLDSDDYIDRETLQIAVQTAEEKDLDAAVFGFERFSDSEELLAKYPFQVNIIDNIQHVSTGVEYLKIANERGAYTASVWTALWRHSFLEDNNLLFMEGILHEDILFSFQAYMTAKRVMYIPYRFYHYRARSDSITTKPNSSIRVMSYFESVKGVLRYALQGEYDSDKEHEIWRAYREYCEVTYRLYNAISKDEQKNIVFSGETESELFSQVMSGFQLRNLQNELKIQNEEKRKLQDALKRKTEETAEIQDKLKVREKKIDDIQRRLRMIYLSRSYRIGRKFTWFMGYFRKGKMVEIGKNAYTRLCKALKVENSL